MATLRNAEQDSALAKSHPDTFRANLTRRGQLVKIGYGEGARWRLAARERELL